VYYFLEGKEGKVGEGRYLRTPKRTWKILCTGGEERSSQISTPPRKKRKKRRASCAESGQR